METPKTSAQELNAILDLGPGLSVDWWLTFFIAPIRNGVSNPP
jgi:hypothetical protein